MGIPGRQLAKAAVNDANADGDSDSDSEGNEA